MKQDIYIF